MVMGEQAAEAAAEAPGAPGTPGAPGAPGTTAPPGPVTLEPGAGGMLTTGALPTLAQESAFR